MKRIEDNQSPFQRAMVEGLIERSNNPINPRTKRPGRPREGSELGWMEPFLDGIAEGLSIDNATIVANVHPTTVYQRRREDEEFRKRWNQAAEVGTRLLEQEAQRRAYHGVDEPVFHKGIQCGSIKKYSDTLMIFLLKARKPAVYRDGVDESGRAITAVNINVVEHQPDAPKRDNTVNPVGIEVVTVGGDSK